MKTSLLIAALFLVTVSASAQSFRGVSWGMSRADVAATGDDPDSFRATAFGLPAVIRYTYADDRLAGIAIDLTRPHDAATIEVADATLADMARVADSLTRAFGYRGAFPDVTREDRACPGFDGDLARRVLGGCLVRVRTWGNLDADARLTVDGDSGRITHTLTITSRMYSAAPGDRALPSVMSLD